MAEWIEKTKELPPLEVAVWAYYSNEPWSSVRRVWRGGMMMYEEDEGQWKGMGSAGDEYTHWMRIEPPAAPGKKSSNG